MDIEECPKGHFQQDKVLVQTEDKFLSGTNRQKIIQKKLKKIKILKVK